MSTLVNIFSQIAAKIFEYFHMSDLIAMINRITASKIVYVLIPAPVMLYPYIVKGFANMTKLKHLNGKIS